MRRCDLADRRIEPPGCWASGSDSARTPWPGSGGTQPQAVAGQDSQLSNEVQRDFYLLHAPAGRTREAVDSAAGGQRPAIDHKAGSQPEPRRCSALRAVHPPRGRPRHLGPVPGCQPAPRSCSDLSGATLHVSSHISISASATTNGRAPQHTRTGRPLVQTYSQQLRTLAKNRV